MVFNRWNRTRDREAPLRRKLATWPLVLALLAGATFVLSRFGLGLGETESIGLSVFAVFMTLLVAWLPQTGTPLNTALHVFLTFHFTVISRIFFRAESFDAAKRMCAGLMSFDTAGLRPGLLTPWLWLALVLGTAYHFTPRNWVDVRAYAIFRRIPGPVLGLAMGLLALGLMKLMAGAPRAFIYFAF
jgi:alginate O-acetyltransferase complex protein AlgI